MKLKYFLRGFGLGILFTTIMLAISFYLKASDTPVMTDEQIIEQAKKLGMVEKESITEENSLSETEQKLKICCSPNIPIVCILTYHQYVCQIYLRKIVNTKSFR